MPYRILKDYGDRGMKLESEEFETAIGAAISAEREDNGFLYLIVRVINFDDVDKCGRCSNTEEELIKMERRAEKRINENKEFFDSIEVKRTIEYLSGLSPHNFWLPGHSGLPLKDRKVSYKVKDAIEIILEVFVPK